MQNKTLDEGHLSLVLRQVGDKALASRCDCLSLTYVYVIVSHIESKA